jgi:ankyrin repeat protein
MTPELINATLIFGTLLLAMLLVYLLNRKRWRLWRVIQSGDPQQVEYARNQVTPQLVPYLMKKYWHELDWERKRSIVELLQDQGHPDISKLMLDFLRVPLEAGDEQTELAQAIALSFIDERYDRFMEYYNNRDLLAQDVRAVLGKHGLSPEMPLRRPAPISQPVAAPPQDVHPNQRLINGIAANNIVEVQQALSQKANINVHITKGTYKGCSALIYATLMGCFEIAQFLIEQRADIHFTRPDLQGNFHPGRGQSALWWAANHGYLPLAAELIQRGANVNTPDHHGGTPLTTAASAGRVEMVRYLVEHGADIHARLSTQFPGGVSDGRKAIHLAVTNGHVEVVKYLLDQGCDPNEPGGSGYTPLIVAAENNFYDLADLLIARGADVNAPHAGTGGYIGLRGMTPLAFSISAGFVRMSKLLIRSGADVHYRVPAGKRWDGKPIPERSMIDFAKGKRAESVKKLLISHGVQE